MFILFYEITLDKILMFCYNRVNPPRGTGFYCLDFGDFVVLARLALFFMVFFAVEAEDFLAVF